MTGFGGLVVRRECWTLSWRGKLVLLGLGLAFALAARWEAYPFLAVNHPVNGSVLIVEGWISPNVLNQTAVEFARGKYRRLLVVRAVYDAEHPFAGRASDEFISARLLQYGVPRDSLYTLFYTATQRDRTYHSALAAKDWFAKIIECGDSWSSRPEIMVALPKGLPQYG